MSNTTDNQDPNETSEEGNFRRQLEKDRDKAREEAKQLKEQLTQRDRSDAFKSAGLDLSLNEDGKPKNPLHQLFAKSWEGDNDIEAIKASASETGVLSSSQQQTTDPTLQALASQHAFLDQAAAGAPPAAISGSVEAFRNKLESDSLPPTIKEYYAMVEAAGGKVYNNG